MKAESVLDLRKSNRLYNKNITVSFVLEFLFYHIFKSSEYIFLRAVFDLFVKLTLLYHSINPFFVCL